MNEDKRKLQNIVNKQEISEDELSQVAGGATLDYSENMWEKNHDGEWYYFSQGEEIKGWQDDNTNTNKYYYNSEKTQEKRDWEISNNNWYYVDGDDVL